MNGLTETESMIRLIVEADNEDLCVLADYVTDRGKGRLALDGTICRALSTARDNLSFSPTERQQLALEILQFGGNTVSNFVRGLRRSFGSAPPQSASPVSGGPPTVPYEEIVRDVARKMKVSVAKQDQVSDMESAIIRHVLTESLAKMDNDAQDAVLEELTGIHHPPGASAAALAGIAAGAASGFATYRLAVIVANSVARTLTGRGLTLATNATLMRALGLALGPVGWAVTGLWTVADLASPAYRVTVPCVVQLAYIRQKALNKVVRVCAACANSLGATATECPDCGQQVEGSR